MSESVMNHSCVKWSSEEPKTAGVYLWREVGKKSKDANMCNIFYCAEHKMLEIEFLWCSDQNKTFPLSELASREWLRIPA